MNKTSCSEEEVDYWRDTNVRYLGYANEVGEAIGAIEKYRKIITPSYVVAFGYVGCDTYDKTMKAIKLKKSRNEILVTCCDTFIWQLFASVLIPGKIIHVIANGATDILKKEAVSKKITSGIVRNWGPTTIGLVAIPFIIHPIDNFVDFMMNNTLRKYWK